MKMICFPHAGGLSYYYTFLKKAELFGIDEVYLFEYPMRGRRAQETHYRDFDDLATSAAEELIRDGWCDGPYVLFGHSLGGFAAFETAKVLDKKYGRPPALVIVSGQKPPSMVEPEHYRKCEEEGLAFLKKLGGIPEDMTRCQDAMHYFVELCRADLRLLQTYAPKPAVDEARLPAGIVMYGRDDIEFDPKCLVHWKAYFRKLYAIREFEGNHFYLNDRKSEVLSYLDQCLRALFPEQGTKAAD